MINFISKNLPSNLNSLKVLIELIKFKLYNFRINMSKISEVCLILDEMVSNIIDHSFEKYLDNQTFFIEILYDEIEKQIFMTFENSGPKFNLLEYNIIPDYTVSIEDVKIGGLGIKFIKEISDDIKYEYTEEKKNRTFITKSLK